MKPLALGLGLLGGVVGAVGWALISWKIGYEIGLIAWGVGLLVGLGFYFGGASGKPMAVIAAAVALVSIFAGKGLAVKWSVADSFLAYANEVALSEETYEEMLRDVQQFSKIEGEDQYPAFMRQHGFRQERDEDAEVTAEEIEWFKSELVPILRRYAESKPSYEQWKVEKRERMKKFEQEMKEVARGLASQFSWADVVDEVKHDLDPIDILFAFLGVASAFGIVAREQEA